MDKQIEEFIDEVKTHPFWLRRSVTRNSVLKLYRYAKKLESRECKEKNYGRNTRPKGK